MKAAPAIVLVTRDVGLLAHWQRVFGTRKQAVATGFDDLFQLKLSSPCVVWVDLSLAGRAPWASSAWQDLLTNESIRVIAASSSPKDEEAILALDAGCAAYCHAFADAATLKQVKGVVGAGHVWIGKSLMQRLLQGVNQVLPSRTDEDLGWRESLTQREVEIAELAANGASNQSIASHCKISERTVKAHLSAVFEKLNITDRLQLALRVHGIS